MRTIKFRAWDKKNRYMSTMFDEWFAHPETYSIDCGISFGDTFNHKSKVEDFEIMQFTGLLDKNKVEIYEGDIVRMRFDDCELYWNETNFITRFENGGFVFKLIEEKSNVWDINASEGDEQCEVIGDIHQNPELL